MSDASRLAEELRTEHEHSGAVERGAKATFAQCNELQARLEEAEAAAASYGRKMIAKLEEKVRMLESELGTCQVRWEHSRSTLSVFRMWTISGRLRLTKEPTESSLMKLDMFNVKNCLTH